MIGYRRESFRKAFNLIRELKNDPKNLKALLALQLLLIKEIKLTEQRIRLCKKKLTNSPAPNNHKQQQLDKRLENFRFLNNLWRSFGDAIAFIYLDKYALKHTFFSVHDYKPKQQSGFLTGKEGFDLELACLKRANCKTEP